MAFKEVDRWISPSVSFLMLLGGESFQDLEVVAQTPEKLLLAASTGSQNVSIVSMILWHVGGLASAEVTGGINRGQGQ